MGRKSKYGNLFKIKVAIEGIYKKESLEDLSKHYDVPIAKIREWIDDVQNIKDIHTISKTEKVKKRHRTKAQTDAERLKRQVSHLKTTCEFFADGLRKCKSNKEIKELEQERPNGLSRLEFCRYLDIAPSSLYYTPKGENKENLAIMDSIDRYHSEHPYAGVRMITDSLRPHQTTVSVKRVRRLMHLMGLDCNNWHKSLSAGGRPRYFRPYLLRNLNITHKNQVWCTDISYVRTIGGYMFLYAYIDVYSRYIVGWRLCKTLNGTNCYELLEDCIGKYGNPEIVNTDQGCQFSSIRWEKLLRKHNIRQSMDGKGRFRDNIWIERFWRTIKQEYIYNSSAESEEELLAGISEYISFYNFRRPHMSLNMCFPATKYGIVV